jgi:hypothetical protein
VDGESLAECFGIWSTIRQNPSVSDIRAFMLGVIILDGLLRQEHGAGDLSV